MAKPDNTQQEDLDAAEQALRAAGIEFDDGSEDEAHFPYEGAGQRAGNEDDGDGDGGEDRGGQDARGDDAGGDDAGDKGGDDGSGDEDGDDGFAASLSEQDRSFYENLPDEAQEWVRAKLEGSNPYADLEGDDRYKGMFEGATAEQKRAQFANLLDVQNRFNEDPIGLARDILDTHQLPYDRILPDGQRQTQPPPPGGDDGGAADQEDDAIVAARAALEADEDMEDGTKAVLGSVLSAIGGIQKTQREQFQALETQQAAGRQAQTRAAFGAFASETTEGGEPAHPHYRRPDVQRAMEALMSRDPAFHRAGQAPTTADFKRVYLAATAMIPKYRDESIEAQVQARLAEEREKAGNKGGGERQTRRRTTPRSGQRTRFPGRSGSQSSGGMMQIPGMGGMSVPKGKSTREQLDHLLDQQGLN